MTLGQFIFQSRVIVAKLQDFGEKSLSLIRSEGIHIGFLKLRGFDMLFQPENIYSCDIRFFFNCARILPTSVNGFTVR